MLNQCSTYHCSLRPLGKLLVEQMMLIHKRSLRCYGHLKIDQKKHSLDLLKGHENYVIYKMLSAS